MAEEVVVKKGRNWQRISVYAFVSVLVAAAIGLILMLNAILMRMDGVVSIMPKQESIKTVITFVSNDGKVSSWVEEVEKVNVSMGQVIYYIKDSEIPLRLPVDKTISRKYIAPE